MKPRKTPFTAIVRMVPTVPVPQPAAGRFGPENPKAGDPIETWSASPCGPEGSFDGRVFLQFYALDGSDACGVLHKVMQRHVRGIPRPGQKRRPAYSKDDYAVLELKNSATGAYEIGSGAHPDMKPKRRGKDRTMEMQFV